jgi:8-oxo-dGTP pyrophosphatase MutT (NUDIX family)
VTRADPLATILGAISAGWDNTSDYDLNPEITLPPGRRLRPAGVLVPVILRAGVPQVLLTVRSSALKHHPGQIAFPGGKQDVADPDIRATALREAQEEIGLAPESVSIIGHLPRHETVTGFDVTPVLARVSGPFTPRLDPGEVAELFEVPLSHVMDPGRFRVEKRRWKGVWRYYYAIPYGPYYIWGATARMLRMMAAMAAPR